ncbi:MAG: CDP-glucose 4,6-dehydratase [Candidatus Nanopelagicales bacterium]
MTSVFVTGHTGFKGSWFTACAARSGAELHGYALDPLAGGFFEQCDVGNMCASHTIGDIRDRESLENSMKNARPDVLVHMAAQPLVRESYLNPRETFDVNVMGTLNVLEAAVANGVSKIMVITSDKVYRNTGSTVGYSEDAPLGGHDPYSASKAMAEILTQSWALSYPADSIAIVTARAGNVIGGGDRSPDRLLPDLINSVVQGQPLVLRYPNAVRPWQHVLDVTSGYLAVLRAMQPADAFTSWNIGPDPEERVTVKEVAEIAIDQWGSGVIDVSNEDRPHEAAMLVIDPSKANHELGWTSALTVDAAVRWTVDWEVAVANGKDVWATSLDQIEAYEAALTERGVANGLAAFDR